MRKLLRATVSTLTAGFTGAHTLVAACIHPAASDAARLNCQQQQGACCDIALHAVGEGSRCGMRSSERVRLTECQMLSRPNLDCDMCTDTAYALQVARAKRTRSPANLAVSTPAGALPQAYKRQRALQPLPGLSIACHSAQAVESAESRLVSGKRPSEGTPAEGFSQQRKVAPFSGSPVHMVGSCFEPYVSIGPRRRATDACGPGPSVLAHSSSVLSPLEACSDKLCSRNSIDVAEIDVHDAAQTSSLPQLPPSSLVSSLTTLQLTSLEVDPSCSSLVPKGQDPTGPDIVSPCEDDVRDCSPCLHRRSGLGGQGITSCPTIITDGSHVLAVSPRSLVTPCKSQAPLECNGPHGVARKDSSDSPRQTTDSHPLPSSSFQGVFRQRRHLDSPSDDDASDSPALPGGLLTPQCMPVVSSLQHRSPSEHQNASSAGSGSAGRLVCNLIERFNNTQLYDGINESPQLVSPRSSVDVS